MKLSVIYSIYNRSDLFSRALRSVYQQTMPKEDYELVVIDDGSTEPIKSRCLAPYKGKMNIRYIRYDRRLHPIYKEMNPTLYFPDEFAPTESWPTLTSDENWCHTQAISGNIGLQQSTGEICLISQPEMIHMPDSFLSGYNRAKEGKMVFSEILHASEDFNGYLSAHPYALKSNIESLWAIANSYPKEYELNHMPSQNFYEMYWYAAYFPRQSAINIGGIDLRYQRGVYAEDDQFKVRMRLEGSVDTWGGRPNLEGSFNGYSGAIHQSHLKEKEIYKKQDRQSRWWDERANHNRALWQDFQHNPYVVANTDLDYSPWGEFLIKEDTKWPISSLSK